MRLQDMMMRLQEEMLKNQEEALRMMTELEARRKKNVINITAFLGEANKRLEKACIDQDKANESVIKAMELGGESDIALDTQNLKAANSIVDAEKLAITAVTEIFKANDMDPEVFSKCIAEIMKKESMFSEITEELILATTKNQSLFPAAESATTKDAKLPVTAVQAALPAESDIQALAEKAQQEFSEAKSLADEAKKAKSSLFAEKSAGMFKAVRTQYQTILAKDDLKADVKEKMQKQLEDHMAPGRPYSPTQLTM